MSNLDPKSIVNSLKWHMETQEKLKSTMTTKMFKTIMRNKKERQKYGIEVEKCCICSKMLIATMSMIIPDKYHRYMGRGMMMDEEKNRYIMACTRDKKCYEENFEWVDSKYVDGKRIKGYYKPKTELAQSILTKNNYLGNR